MIGEVLDAHGKLDILVNNAGITIDKTVRKMTAEDWDRVVQVNLSGAFYLSRAILQHMLDRGSGRIINISSIIGEAGNIGQANYAASKSGLFGLTMSLAQETARKGITVNSVAPGYISTEMVRAVPQGGPGTRSSPRSRSAASANPTRSPASSSSSPTPTPASSPARSTRSTAASTCRHGADLRAGSARRSAGVRVLSDAVASGVGDPLGRLGGFDPFGLCQDGSGVLLAHHDDTVGVGDDDVAGGDDDSGDRDRLSQSSGAGAAGGITSVMPAPAAARRSPGRGRSRAAPKASRRPDRRPRSARRRWRRACRARQGRWRRPAGRRRAS